MLPRLYPDEDPLPVVGLLYVGEVLVLLPVLLDAGLPLETLLLDVVLLLTEDLLVLLPTLMPPRIVPLVALTELDGLLDIPLEWLPANAPLDSVRARRPWYVFLWPAPPVPMCEGPE